ncbi:MAG: glucan biosynthesis protein [Reyranella sp.]|uniref:acyltransferase family protein n=1 Tax=Reyranella sp. TaxID=1929291 RepID=UPI0011F7DFDB|nr:acyltransferase family protein [Reyranella sp.]TAJ96137.1 MAG: glucan biosynthesis protein [Reyranella sp.]TBR26547.1 MAG: glucan biosynthesis protein [Reyranella sp.]
MQPAAFATRRADLDWLRVLAFGLLIFYHAGMAWSGWTWHVTSPDSLEGLREAMRFLNRWRMPLIFVVSGAAVMLALGNRTPGAFVRDRLKRLLLPLAFGMAVIVPPQVYLERLYSGQFTGSFLQWLPHAFDGVYPKGNLSWHHLWFVAYVLVLTLVLLPVFLWARSAAGQAAVGTAGRSAARFGLQWLMVLPLAASTLWLAPISWNINGLIGDWHGLVSYGALLLYGAFIFGSPDLLEALQRQRLLSLAVGLIAYAILYVGFFAGTVRPTIPPEARPVFALLSAVNVMAWLFAIIGFARRYLVRRPAFLSEATEAVYPFYLIHQTVTVIAVWGLLQIGAPPLLGFVAAVVATFAGTWLIYAGLVRPWRWIRPLFGMKALVPEARRSLPRRAAGL